MSINKKGQFDLARKSIFWFIAGIVITMAVIIFAVSLSTFQGKYLELDPAIEAEFVSLRFYNNPDCFAYQDPLTGRTYLGTIDIEKFNDQRLQECYFPGFEDSYKDLNFRLSLEGFNPVDEQGNDIVLATRNYFHQRSATTLVKDVLVVNNGVFMPSVLVIEVQQYWRSRNV